MDFINAINEAGWLNVLTGALAIATVWLAFATHRMAAATKEMVALEGRPYLVFKDLLFRFFVPAPESASTTSRIKIGLVFSNPGRIRVRYTVKSIRVTFSGTTADNPRFATMGGDVFPSDQTVFWYDAFPFTGKLTPPFKGVVEFDVEFRGLEADKPSHLRRKLEYTVLSVDPFRCDWLYLDEHNE